MLGFFVWMITRMLIWNAHKPWDVLFCYGNPILFCNPKTYTRKGLIIYKYNKWNNNIEKNVNVETIPLLQKCLKKNVNNPMKREVEQTICKNMIKSNDSAIVNFVTTKKPSRRIICIKYYFLKIWARWLFKIIYPCNLLKVCGQSVYICICVQDWFFLPKFVFTRNDPIVGGKN